MKDILDMEGWSLTDKRTDGLVETFSAEYVHEPIACSKCGGIKLYRHGTKKTTYADAPLRGFAAKLEATVRRYRCLDCGETFLQPLGGVLDERRMTVLICEDLARADPAMPVLRAVGPNLVVALLMDGPQLDSRWPARYATVLADDPGSSVLTITCAGMVDRSNYMQANPRRSVGLWRHANGHMQELFLPKQHYGLLLTLRSVEEEQFSLDHRSDGSLTSRLELEWFKPLPLPTVPAWVEGLS